MLKYFYLVATSSQVSGLFLAHSLSITLSSSRSFLAREQCACKGGVCFSL